MSCNNKPNLLIQRPSLDISEVKCKDIIEEEDEEDDEISADLPSFKSVIFKGDQQQLNDLFYDAEKGQYVNVDNFAFADHANHFEENTPSEASSSLALLDSRILDETSTNIDDSRIILEELKRNINEESSSASQPNSLDVSFEDGKPKIFSPREKTPPKRKSSPSMRKLSTESQTLPSKTSDDSTSGGKKKFVKKKVAKNAGGQATVQRRLNLDKNSRKLGQNKSHSASNLHKLSVKDYHESFQLRRVSSSSAT